MGNIRLTQTVKKGGCAAKISAVTLRRVLSGVDLPIQDENLLVSNQNFDDAGVYKISDSQALVETLDFFTPIVDTPTCFGRIAAANALSDVYAMGGRPKTCMCILAFPCTTLDESVMTEILQGAAQIIRESRSVIVGGHSIDDDTIKFGLAVTGFVNPDHMWTNDNVRVGDDLILTKPIGTGTLMSALKNGKLTEDDISEAIFSMSKLNNVIDFINPELINAATDITGFGLMGHALNMAQASSVTLNFDYSKIPIFDLADRSIEEGNLTLAHSSNREYTITATNISEKLSENEEKLLYDPQTSGGLLLSVDPHNSQMILSQINREFPRAQIIGTVSERLPDAAHTIKVF